MLAGEINDAENGCLRRALSAARAVFFWLALAQNRAKRTDLKLFPSLTDETILHADTQ